MNKTAFLDALQVQLNPLPGKERQQYIDFYCEMIDDRMEDGISEAEAVAALGSPKEIAALILADTPQEPAPKFRVWEIILLVLGSPIWLALGVGVCMILLSLIMVIAAAYITLWSAVITLYAADLCLLAGVVTCIAAGCFYTGSAAAPVLLFFGAALVCGGSCVLLFFGCNKLAVWLARLGKWSLLRVIGLFRRKGEVTHA